jgi:hypothetical protein
MNRVVHHLTALFFSWTVSLRTNIFSLNFLCRHSPAHRGRENMDVVIKRLNESPPTVPDGRRHGHFPEIHQRCKQ